MKTKKPSKMLVDVMAKTPLGAIEASILKWQWYSYATKREILRGAEPICGLCWFYASCLLCPLGNKESEWISFCDLSNTLYSRAMDTLAQLDSGEATLAQFRARARRLLKRLQAIKKRETRKKKKNV